MQSLLIQGGTPLTGEIAISGSKNAVLPMLASTVAFREPCRIRQAPHLTDVDTALEILTYLGGIVQWEADDLLIDPRGISRWRLPPALMGKMRGSVFFAGPLMARFGACSLTTPGGCPLGERPVNYHAQGLLALGAKRDSAEPEVFSGKLFGSDIYLPYPSVGATENLILAALGAQGATTIHNAAREPEICCLCDFLRSGGAAVSGDGTREIVVTGGLPKSGDLAVIPDRMEAATFACAVASAGGSVRLNRANHRHLTKVLDVLEKAGCQIDRQEDYIVVEAQTLRSPGEIVTEPYPGFPTDAQATIMAALLRAEGESVIRETVFDHRMHHVEGLKAMGGQIALRGNTARITGVKTLNAAEVTACDLRGGAALAIAALAAKGTSSLTGLAHIQRGYEHFAEKLQALGASARMA